MIVRAPRHWPLQRAKRIGGWNVENGRFLYVEMFTQFIYA